MKQQRMTRYELEKENEDLRKGLGESLDILEEVSTERDDLRTKLLVVRAILVFIVLIALILLAMVI